MGCDFFFVSLTFYCRTIKSECIIIIRRPKLMHIKHVVEFVKSYGLNHDIWGYSWKIFPSTHSNGCVIFCQIKNPSVFLFEIFVDSKLGILGNILLWSLFHIQLVRKFLISLNILLPVFVKLVVEFVKAHWFDSTHFWCFL